MFGGANEAERSEGRRVVLQCVKALKAPPHKLKDTHPWIVKFEHELKRDKMMRKRKEKRKKKNDAAVKDHDSSSSSSSSSSSDEEPKDEVEEENDNYSDEY